METLQKCTLLKCYFSKSLRALWHIVVLSPVFSPVLRSVTVPRAERDVTNPRLGREAGGDPEGEVVHLLGPQGAAGVLKMDLSEATLTFGS